MSGQVCLRSVGKGGLVGQTAMGLRKAALVDREEYPWRPESGVEPVPAYRFEWRVAFDNVSLNALHAEAFGHELLDYDWEEQVLRHNLGWVRAYEADKLVGFVNVPWDGGSHAFILDTVVSTRGRRRGVGKRLVATAVPRAREAGCEWIHVDFEDHLRRFYFGACWFEPTNEALIAL
jgi:ribosomal protein S18 acetylase RimI-like enzyme